MSLLDMMFGWLKWYRRMRGGLWFYASYPDGGWTRDYPSEPFLVPHEEDYR